MVLLLPVYIPKLYPLKDNTSTCALFSWENSPGSYFTSLPDDPKKSLFAHMASSYASLFVTNKVFTHLFRAPTWLPFQHGGHDVVRSFHIMAVNK